MSTLRETVAGMTTRQLLRECVMRTPEGRRWRAKVLGTMESKRLREQRVGVKALRRAARESKRTIRLQEANERTGLRRSLASLLGKRSVLDDLRQQLDAAKARSAGEIFDMREQGRRSHDDVDLVVRCRGEVRARESRLGKLAEGVSSASRKLIDKLAKHGAPAIKREGLDADGVPEGYGEVVEKLSHHMDREAARAAAFGMADLGMEAGDCLELARLHAGALSEKGGSYEDDGESGGPAEDREDRGGPRGEDEVGAGDELDGGDDDDGEDDEPDDEDDDDGDRAVRKFEQLEGERPREDFSVKRVKKALEGGDDPDSTADGLPPKVAQNYRYAADPAVSCATCTFHDEAMSRCAKLNAAVRAVDVCDAWQESKKFTAEVRRAMDFFGRDA